MKKIFSSLFTIIIAVVIFGAFAFWLAPATFERTWKQAGLPITPLVQLERVRGQTPKPHETRLYGTLEASIIHVASEIDGRATEVLVAEGDLVARGQPVVQLDDTDVRAQSIAALEAVEAARAARDAVAAPPSKTIITIAERKVSAAKTNLRNAKRSLQQAQVMYEKPVAITNQISQTAALIPAAKANVEAAKASLSQAQVLIDDATTNGSREGQFKTRMLEEQKLAAEEILKAAQSRLDGLYMTLSLLKEVRSKPLTLIVNVHRAEDQVSLARAALKVAEAERNASTAPPSPEEVALAEASIQKAEAALAIARWQEDRLLITSPIAGRIQAQMIKSGEVVQAGKPLLRIADTSRMEVWAYVPQEDLHTVSLGARFPVEVIAIPDQRFEGEVFFIASEAQFRPNNVLNPDDRGDMVFLFKLWLDNTDGVLKPGMPADVILP